jgi:type II secretory pathway pseudopilin PulG
MQQLRRCREGSFTLLEMMVSTVVLAILVMLVAQMLSSATTISTLGGKRNDSDNQARLIFDRMASDFAGMVRRPDVDYIFAKQNGNDTMYFYSEAAKYFEPWIGDASKSSIALVGYRVNSNFQLERLSQGLTWDGIASPSSSPSPSPGSVVFLAYPSPSPGGTPFPGSTMTGNWPTVVGDPPGYVNGSSASYHVIGDQVYRFEVSFLQIDGTIKSSAAQYNGLQGVAGLVVAIGVLDKTSRTLLLQNGQIPAASGNQMVNALPDAVDGSLILQTWKASTYLTTSGIPQASAAQLRIYERIFYLNTQ